MRKVAILLILLVVIVTLVVPASSCSKTSTSTSGGTIKIGLITDLSGPFASMSKYEVPAVQMVVDAYNAKGGILGRQIELVQRDDVADPGLVGQKADELKAAGVVGIIGAAIDADNEALSIWAKTNHVPIANGSSADLTMRTTNYSGYNFFCTPTGWTYAKVLAEWAAKQDSIKSVAAIATDMGANHAVVDAFWPFMKQLKPSVTDLGTIYTSATEQDFSSAISATLTKKPDLILDLCAGPSGLAWIQQAKQFNVFNTCKVAGMYILGADVAQALGKDYPEGIQAIDNCPYWINTPEMQDFTTEYMKRTNNLYPGSISMAFYLSAQSLIEAVKKANSTDPDKIVKAYETLTVSDSPIGSYSFNDYDHQAEVALWMNTSGYSSNYPNAIGLNPIKYQKGVYPTKDEITALRNVK